MTKKAVKYAVVAALIGAAGYYTYTRYNKKYLIGEILRKSDLEDTPENRSKLEGSTTQELRNTLLFY